MYDNHLDCVVERIDDANCRIIVFETDNDTGARCVKDIMNGTNREVAAYFLAIVCEDEGLRIRKG